MMAANQNLEAFFAPFRENIIGINQAFTSPFGIKKILYADWTASGRAYQPVEDHLQQHILPFVANTHTGSTVTGSLMTRAYEEAKATVKRHVNANEADVLIFCGSGMTSAVNKLQRILGLRIPERLAGYLRNGFMPEIDEAKRPVIFITHMEHHSNQTSWLETIATVEIIGRNIEGNIDLQHFAALLSQYKNRQHKIAAITACSNVTGIETPYHEIARMIHLQNGLCFVDFACSAPYVAMDMHPQEPGTHLDAIYFSQHKFLGGPGTPGVLIFNKKLYTNNVPDHPGGGTVDYSNCWQEHDYVKDIEQREDGGTPPFLQAIKAARCILLKEAMTVENIRLREQELLAIIFSRFASISNAEVLEPKVKQRLGVVSFIIKNAHYNLVVKLLNDRFGIQLRGGCSCAGTYGHYLMGVDHSRSGQIRSDILAGDLNSKPGWVRLSIHPTMTNQEINFLMDGIAQVAVNYETWGKDYCFQRETNEFVLPNK